MTSLDQTQNRMGLATKESLTMKKWKILETK